MCGIMSRLTGKVAIVTGSSGGIGSATVTAFARDGADIVLHYRSKEAEAKALQEQVTALGFHRHDTCAIRSSEYDGFDHERVW
jgi:NAD(P)-dependent dehydrogenase (short-subunit alcohol dehydrogenase family)